MKELREYQEQAKESLFNQIQKGKEQGLIVLATGLGKTVLCAAFVMEVLRSQLGSPRALFLVHMRDIVLQAKEEFDERLNGNGLTTGVHMGGQKENVSDSDVLLATLQSINTDEFDKNEFDLLVVDEAHHGRAETFEEVITHFDPLFRMGMTATPDREDDLDIRELFGEEVFSFPLSKALDSKWLADVNYLLVTDNLAMDYFHQLEEKIEAGDRDITLDEVEKHLFANENLAQVKSIVENKRKEGDRTAIYCRNLDHLNRVHEHFPEAVPYHSKVDKDDREQILNQFRSGEIKKLLVVDALNEGVDIPKMNCLVFLRSTSSEIVWKQQLGRGLRNPDQSGDRVTVLDFVGNCRRVLQISELSQNTDSFKTSQVYGTDEGETTEEIETEKLNLNEEQVDLIEVVEQLETLRREFYDSYEQARQAVQSLDPVPIAVHEYREFYKQDPKLPFHPNELYPEEWQGWRHFLGKKKKDFYSTLEEAKQAVQDLNPVPTSKREYQKVYDQDPKLPSSPYKTYSEEWQGWSKYLGKYYSTLEEAKQAVQDLNPVPTSGPDYQKVYDQDPKLPSSPYKTYSEEWQGWRYFLGTERWTYERVKEHIHSKGFANLGEYMDYARNHPNLKVNPRQYDDYEGAAKFLGKDKD